MLELATTREQAQVNDKNGKAEQGVLLKTSDAPQREKTASLEAQVGAAFKTALEKSEAWRSIGIRGVAILGSLPPELSSPTEFRFVVTGRAGDVYECRGQYIPQEQRAVVPQYDPSFAARTPLQVSNTSELQPVPSKTAIEASQRAKELNLQLMRARDRFWVRHVGKAVTAAAVVPIVVGSVAATHFGAGEAGVGLGIMGGMIGGLFTFLASTGTNDGTAESRLIQANRAVAEGKLKKAAGLYALAAYGQFKQTNTTSHRFQKAAKHAEIAACQLVQVYAQMESPLLEKAVEHYLLRFPDGKHVAKVRAFLKPVSGEAEAGT